MGIRDKFKSCGRIWKCALAATALVLVAFSGYIAYIYLASPAIIRQPLLEHYHFRMQIIVDGKAEDFSSKAYQQHYAKGQCNSLLPDQPIHFHDDKAQITHIHWESMTGGQVMKYYGWNYVGGVGGALGYRFEKPLHPKKVQIHGNILPSMPNDDQLYVYSGDENSHKERSFDDWKSQDLEKFFGKTSNFPAHKINKQKTGLFDGLFPKAYANEDVAMNMDTTNSTGGGGETVTEKRKRINNLIGNVVIFAQKSKPTEKQVTDRFNHLEPLSDSTCGG